MRYIIESHCHSCYSHDCGTPIKAIVRSCCRKKVNIIIINDHDVFGLTEADELLFKNANILVLRGIEFTTKENVHIIGVCPNIKELEREPHYYSAVDLVSHLKKLKALVIVPHPDHQTGLLGNNNVSNEIVVDVLSNANFVECNNLKYGATKSIPFIMEINPDIKWLIGSDAHTRYNVGAFVNYANLDVKIETDDDYGFLYNIQLEHVYNKQHTRLHKSLKRLQQSVWYKFLIARIRPQHRRFLKRLLINR